MENDHQELRRALSAIAVVGRIDGHDVIRRLSVIDIAQSRETAANNAPQNPLVQEYEDWIRFFNAGEGDYTDFLRKRGLA
jgi:hypothetical protein